MKSVKTLHKSFHISIYIAFCVLIALLIEGLLFNHFYFRYHLGDYQSTEVNLPYNEYIKGQGVVLDKNNKQITLNDINLPLLAVSFSVLGPNNKVNGSVFIRDESNVASFVPGNIFTLVPNMQQPYEVRTYVVSNGNALGVAISLNDLKKQAIITNITLNPNPKYTFYFSRFFLIALGLTCLMLVFKLKLYQYKLNDLNNKAKAAMYLGSMCFCFMLASLLFIVISPKNIDPNLIYDYNERGFIHIGNKEQSYLLDFPQNKQEIVFFDPYVKTMDALNKGQLHLDVDIDPKLLEMDNPYDNSLRSFHKAEGYWDHSFYQGKFYSYYGYGPVITLYYPIYWLTGKIAAPTVLTFISTLICIGAFFFASSGIIRFMRLNSNVLILGVSQCGLLIGSYIFFCEYFISFYGIAPLLSGAYIFLMMGFCFRLPFIQTVLKRRLYLVAIGLCIVMIVQCRPQSLIYGLICSFPILWQLFISPKSTLFKLARLPNYNWHTKLKLIDFTCLSIPVALGAIFTMYTNYARFDSIFEFGQKYCTGLENLLYNKFEFSVDFISHTIYYFYFASFDITKNFPYIALNNRFAQDMGNYHYGDIGLGVFSSPIFLGLLLCIPLFLDKETSAKHMGLSIKTHALKQYKIMLLGILLVMPIIFQIQMSFASFSVRYTMESMLVLAPFVLVLIAKYINFEQNNFSAKVLYVITCYGSIFSILLGTLMAITAMLTQYPYVVPESFIEIGKYFSPLTTFN